MHPEAEKELQVLNTLRQVLSGVVRELTPKANMRHPLSDDMIENVRQSFVLIASREREITEAAGVPSQSRPHFVDDPKAPKVVQLHGLKKDKKD